MNIDAMTTERLRDLRARQYRTAREAERLAQRSVFIGPEYYTAIARNCDQSIIFINDEIERRERKEIAA